MKTSRVFLPAALAASLAFLVASSGPLRAADTKADIPNGDHPAVAIVLNYLDLALKRDWEKSTALIIPESLAAVKKGFIERAKMAPTMDDEFEMVKSVGKKSLEDVEEMDPADFYAAYHRALQERFNLTDAKLKQIADTIDLNVLAVAPEGKEVVHVLVRTRHNDGENEISNLELLSLVKRGSKWLVSLDERGTRITPLAGPDTGR